MADHHFRGPIGHRTCSAIWGPGNNGQRLAHLQSIIHTDTGWEGFGRGMTAVRRRIVEEPDASPPELWQFFLQSSLAALGGGLFSWVLL